MLNKQTINEPGRRPRAPRPRTADDAAARRRRHLERLLDTRARLAEAACRYRAHGVDEAGETTLQQYAVEAAILEDFPAVHAEQFPAWVAHDAEMLEHNPGVLTVDCPICRAIADHGRVNLTEPDAA